MFFDMRGKQKILAVFIIMSLIGGVAGCGASSADKSDINDKTSKEESHNGNNQFEVPTQLPNILVDQVGYNADSEKVAVFRGEKLPEVFYVCDLETDEVVYTGEIVKNALNEELGEVNAIGRFNDFSTPGNYYIRADIVGESYSFTIGEDVYGELFNDACHKYYINRCGTSLSESYAGENAHTACHTQNAFLQDDNSVQLEVSGGWHMDEKADRDTLIGSRVAENLLLAYEMNPEAFSDDSGIPESGNGIPDILDEVRYEVEWLLKMQDSKTGGEYGAAITDSEQSGDVFTAPVYVTSISLDSTIAFAAMMARFSYFYQQFDSEFATTSLRAADRAWNFYINSQKASEHSECCNAAAALYRATGNESYLSVLNTFFAKSDYEQLFLNDKSVFLGSVTYLSTNQPVDMDQCGIIMKLLMKRAEGISTKSASNGYLVTDSAATGDFSAFLDDMKCLTITDHIIYNHEYTTIIENHAHFLMGMNNAATNFVTEGTERTFRDTEGMAGIMNDPQKDALLIFMLSMLQKSA